MGSTYKDLFKLYDLIQSGDVRSVDKFLLENAVNINEILPCKGIGVLHLAVGIEPAEKSRECTEVLLKHGGDPNLSNYEGVSPVHIAAIWGRLDNLKLLIGFGGDPSTRDFDGHSAFDYAAREEQWDVFDYLHNVEDLLDDSLSPSCAYTLDLVKVLMTTDQMVAEYEPIPDSKTDPPHRKLEMVRQWCDKTNTMNKLYPTILCDTFTIDTETEPWKSINITKNMTFDLTSDLTTNNANETNASFKTCLSKKDSPDPVQISGIERLQITSDESARSCLNNNISSDSSRRRFSVYENFSLPGSPNSIMHRNYNSKTNIKKNFSNSSNKKLTDDSESLITEDCSIMDRALALVQNKTNEWLSRSGIIDETGLNNCNTRRSSASSGVSSHMSSGSIALASVHEDYKYEDKQEGVVLIERRLRVSPVVLPVEDLDDANSSALSVASSLPPLVEFDNETLRDELIKLGFRPGPIVDSTRTLYLKKLSALRKNPIVVTTQGKTYSIELEKSLRTNDWMENLVQYIELEQKARSEFSNSKNNWREGNSKTSFTYLLLDPRLTTPQTALPTAHETWVNFVNAIFYVGKGKRSRPYAHLYQAQNLWRIGIKNTQDKKVQHILDIWSQQLGVICLHVFQNVIPVEAYTYEAAMIDVLGLQNLKNLKSGNYYGSVASWPHKDRRMLGLYLLYKAMLIFMNEGERQLMPGDV